MRLFGVSLFALAFFAPLFASAALPPPTCQMSVTPSSIRLGDTVVLRWQSTNASSTTITGVGAVGNSGQINLIPPGRDTTFTGTFIGSGGTSTCQAMVRVFAGGTSGGGGSGGSGSGGTEIVGGSGGSSPLPQLPALSSGETQGGLVPCEGTRDCNMCSLGQLIQRIIKFLIGISIPLAALLFAVAGALYFSSGANPSQKDRAKNIFVDTFVGFLIIIAAWLIVNTVLFVLLNKNEFSNSSWFTISCSTTNRPGATSYSTINEVLNSVLPKLTPSQTAFQPGGTSLNNSSDNFQYNRTGSDSGYNPDLGSALNNQFAGSGSSACGDGYYYMADANEYWCQNALDVDDLQTARYEEDQYGGCASGYNYVANASEFWCQNPNDATDWQEATDYTGGASYSEPQSYNNCYGGDVLQDGFCQGSEGAYAPYSQSNSRSGPEGSCQSGYVYTEDAEYAWCQGPGGADDILDFQRAGLNGKPVVNCIPGNPLCGDINGAMKAYYGTNTRSGPDNGNLACAWAINNVLKTAGVAPIDGNSVQSMWDQLEAGRGTPLSLSEAQEGDIIVWKGINPANNKPVSHVGFCENDACVSAISNSSGSASFTNRSGSTLLGVQGVVYRVNK